MSVPVIIDLAVPIEHGKGRLGMPAAFTTPFTVKQYGWNGSTFCLFCHHGTHVDAPNHFIDGGAAINEVPLQCLMGPASVVELTDHSEGDGRGISGDTLEDRGRHVEPDDIVILKTNWSDLHWGTTKFFAKGPYLEEGGADWLVERGVKSVVYDFSEEEKTREVGWHGDECAIHHKILGNDIYNIEYVRHLSKIERPRCAIMALPLPLVGLDGSPARVIALEGLDIPKEFSVR